MVFQSYALFPHLNIWENIAYGLRVARLPQDEIIRRTSDVVELMHLKGMEKRFPNQLSGGQQQRVALARAVVIEPSVLLFDEPLSNLDAKLRESMRDELRSLQRRLGITSLYVTHDQSEAMAISDKVVIMKDGVIQQTGTPQEVFNHPANLFVADFMGNPAMNFIDGTAQVNGNQAQLSFGGLHGAFVSQALIELEGEEVVVGVRPEYIHISEEGSRVGTVYSTLPAGMETTVKLDVEGTMLTAVVFGDVDYPVDSEVRFDFSKNAILFDKATGRNIANGKITVA